MSQPIVLVADNDRAVSSLLAEVLTRKGLCVVPAYDGEAAFALLRKNTFDALVSDLDMPKRSGLDMLESLRDLPPQPPATVVISGYLDAAIEVRLRALPFIQAMLRKPFDLFEFADCVRRLAIANRQRPAAPAAPAGRSAQAGEFPASGMAH